MKRMIRTSSREKTVQNTKGNGTAQVCGREHEEDQSSRYDSTWDHYCAPSVVSTPEHRAIEMILHTVKWPDHVAQKVGDGPTK